MLTSRVLLTVLSDKFRLAAPSTQDISDTLHLFHCYARALVVFFCTKDLSLPQFLCLYYSGSTQGEVAHCQLLQASNLKYREDKYGHKQSSHSERPLVSVLYKEFPTAKNA